MAGIDLASGLVVLALDPALMIPTFALIGALLVGAVVIAFVRRWQQLQTRLSPTASDELAQYRVLYEQGKISEEEFKRLRDVLGGEIRKANDLPAKPAAPEGPETTAIQLAPSPPSDAAPEPPATDVRPA